MPVLKIDKYSSMQRGRLYAAAGTELIIINHREDVCVVKCKESCQTFTCRTSDIEWQSAGAGDKDANVCANRDGSGIGGEEQTDRVVQQSRQDEQVTGSPDRDGRLPAKDRKQRADSDSAQMNLFG